MDSLLGSKESGYGGNFMLLAIFLLVLFVLFRRDGAAGADAGGLISSATTLLSRASPADQIAINRQANFVDPQIAELLRSQAVDTGTISGLIDRQTCDILRAVDQQGAQARQDTSRIVENQNRIALEAERLFNQRALDDLRDKNAELRAQVSERDSRILHGDTLNALGRSNCELNNRLTRIEDHMVKRPPFFAAGGMPLVSACVPA